MHPKHGRGIALSSKASFYPIRVEFENGVKGNYTKQFSTHVGIWKQTLLKNTQMVATLPYEIQEQIIMFTSFEDAVKLGFDIIAKKLYNIEIHN